MLVPFRPLVVRPEVHLEGKILARRLVRLGQERKENFYCSNYSTPVKIVFPSVYSSRCETYRQVSRIGIEGLRQDKFGYIT